MADAWTVKDCLVYVRNVKHVSVCRLSVWPGFVRVRWILSACARCQVPVCKASMLVLLFEIVSAH